MNTITSRATNVMAPFAVGALLAWGVSGCGSAGPGGTQHVRVAVTEAGFVPSRIEVKRGAPVEITFSRATEQTCGTDVVFKSLNRGYDLPLHREVKVELAAADIGDTLNFSCSMEMLHGMLVAN